MFCATPAAAIINTTPSAPHSSQCLHFFIRIALLTELIVINHGTFSRTDFTFSAEFSRAPGSSLPGPTAHPGRLARGIHTSGVTLASLPVRKRTLRCVSKGVVIGQFRR